MLQGIYIFMTVSISWAFALKFVNMKNVYILYNSIFAGVACTAIDVFLNYTEHHELKFIISIGLFLIMMFAVKQQENCNCSSSVISFLLSTGNFAVLSLIDMLLSNTTRNTYGHTFSLIVASITLYLTIRFGEYFPKKDWESYFNTLPPDPLKLSIRKWHVYVSIGVSCIIMVSGRMMMPVMPLSASLVLILVFESLWFATIFGVILMIHYGQEAITVLLEQQYRREVQSFMNVIRSQRHDYNFHLQIIAGLVNNGDLESCRKYVDEMVQDSITMNNVLPIKDPAISALINSFQTLAAREGIKLNIDIRNDLSHIVTNVYETNKVISNLIQNAIDEVKNHDDKRYGIWLYIIKRGEYCIIHVANTLQSEISIDEYIKNMYRPGYTTKLGHDGVGLSSVRTLLERYGGVIYTRVEENIIHFVAKIPLSYYRNNEDEMQ